MEMKRLGGGGAPGAWGNGPQPYHHGSKTMHCISPLPPLPPHHHTCNNNNNNNTASPHPDGPVSALLAPPPAAIGAMQSGIDRSAREGKLRVLVSLPDRTEKLKLEFPKLATVLAVKQRISKESGMAPSKQMLYHGSTAMHNGRTLKSYTSLTSGDTLFVEPGLLGGDIMCCNETPCDCHCCDCLSFCRCCDACDSCVTYDKECWHCGCLGYPWWVYCVGYVKEENY
eukprot:TRINITY_DN1161_c0_g1_i1.p1 TRINITY_DN1161_c0_g1~~TRINITY_DN1161_c0_g1_i1.p1  ORF type:complete len:227 (-),score=34.08 TRINITY_DN1161_c0_g1_i1:63-743(-)